MNVNVIVVIRCLYSAVSLTLVKEQRFIRIIYYHYYYYNAQLKNYHHLLTSFPKTCLPTKAKEIKFHSSHLCYQCICRHGVSTVNVCRLCIVQLKQMFFFTFHFCFDLPSSPSSLWWPSCLKSSAEEIFLLLGVATINTPIILVLLLCVICVLPFHSRSSYHQHTDYSATTVHNLCASIPHLEQLPLTH